MSKQGAVPLPLALLMLALTVGAAEPLDIDQGERGVLRLDQHLLVLVDPEGKLSLEEAMSRPWQPERRPIPTFGYTRETVWIRFTARSRSSLTETVVVDLATARLSHLRWHVLGEGRLLQAFDAGAADRPTARGEAGRFPLLRLELPPAGERTVVLRVASDTSVWLPLTACDPATYDRMDDRRAWAILLQVGFCLALAFIATLLAFVQRQRTYLHIVWLGLAYALYLGVFNGFLGRIWPSMPLWIEREGLMTGTTLGVFAFTRLNGRLFQGEEDTRLEATLRRTGEALFVLAAALFLTIDFRQAAVALNPLLLAGILANLGAAAARLRRRRGAVELAFVAAWATYASCILWLVLAFTGTIQAGIDVPLAQSLMLPTVLCAFFVAVAARQRSLQQAELQLEKSRTAETEARLEALRYQINPHFLFNTLTSIEGLARTAPASIPELISRLSTFLRLRLLGKPTASLREELEGALAYLDIERTRFGEDLEVDSAAEPAALGRAVPELILQPLVENAVKHGLRAGIRTRIVIRAWVEDRKLIVTVANPGSLSGPNPRQEGFGVGLDNIRRRLALSHGAESSLSLAEADGNVVATLVIAEPRAP